MNTLIILRILLDYTEIFSHESPIEINIQEQN